MIAHHEVAVHMSETQLHNTKDPIILDKITKVWNKFNERFKHNR